MPFFGIYNEVRVSRYETEKAYQIKMFTMIVNSPDPPNEVSIGKPNNDTGSDTLERYRYQNTYTAILGVLMFKGEIEYEKIVCEYHEDVLAVRKNKKLVGIQIKTRDVEKGGFSPHNEPMKNTLKHFIELEKQYGKFFESYEIVSNCGYKKGKNSFDTFIGTKKNFKEKYSKKLIDWLKKETECSTSIVEKMFSKVILTKGPGIQDIHNSLIQKLTEIEIDETIYHFQLNEIANDMVSNVYFRSSNSEKELLRFLLATIGGKPKKESYVINKKTISIDSISNIIKNYVRPQFIGTHDVPLETSEDSIALMKKKLSFGGIDELVINDMEDWVYATDEYILKLLHSEKKEIVEKKSKQIHSVIKRNAIQSFSRTEEKNEQYGRKMLHDLEDRLQSMPENERYDVFGIPFDIMRGIVGRLTGQCLVRFSEEPEGGFK